MRRGRRLAEENAQNQEAMARMLSSACTHLQLGAGCAWHLENAQPQARIATGVSCGDSHVQQSSRSALRILDHTNSKNEMRLRALLVVRLIESLFPFVRESLFFCCAHREPAAAAAAAAAATPSFATPA